MSKIYLSIGSNKGNRYSQIKEALNLIREDIGGITSISKIYETKSWGFESENFLNLCIAINSKLSPDKLLFSINSIEKKIGRKRDSQKMKAREIDIDIIFYSNRIVNQKELIIPHPSLELRNFVLVPLNDIASDFIHPILSKSVKELLESSNDEDIPIESSRAIS
ncbi:MAG: 2-amino-4-hydroxy-6-hydroxymethyldihydropteridine diphosphokinase [Pelagibacterales bacterium]|jgi:2-amino-4-hydroxy-6-hydroxymethyldihydropteridine diphosphokinase|nr:2-amino-4-hydroxy-6-hydroxymethyldihydropteridine diphosphokinase [Pelagibacterales bacterium]